MTINKEFDTVISHLTFPSAKHDDVPFKALRAIKKELNRLKKALREEKKLRNTTITTTTV